mmetsp:Transcript_60787/g.163921  ORF Transcript_60787/g.163921 Transcript_60787/m.163921 type:complete len:546 (+) Transcript_60787:171-1808(+)
MHDEKMRRPAGAVAVGNGSPQPVGTTKTVIIARKSSCNRRTLRKNACELTDCRPHAAERSRALPQGPLWGAKNRSLLGSAILRGSTAQVIEGQTHPRQPGTADLSHTADDSQHVLPGDHPGHPALGGPLALQEVHPAPARSCIGTAWPEELHEGEVSEAPQLPGPEPGRLPDEQPGPGRDHEEPASPEGLRAAEQARILPLNPRPQLRVPRGELEVEHRQGGVGPETPPPAVPRPQRLPPRCAPSGPPPSPRVPQERLHFLHGRAHAVLVRHGLRGPPHVLPHLRVLAALTNLLPQVTGGDLRQSLLRARAQPQLRHPRGHVPLVCPHRRDHRRHPGPHGGLDGAHAPVVDGARALRQQPRVRSRAQEEHLPLAVGLQRGVVVEQAGRESRPSAHHHAAHPRLPEGPHGEAAHLRGGAHDHGAPADVDGGRPRGEECLAAPPLLLVAEAAAGALQEGGLLGGGQPEAANDHQVFRLRPVGGGGEQRLAPGADVQLVQVRDVAELVEDVVRRHQAPMRDGLVQGLPRGVLAKPLLLAKERVPQAEL